ncbi:MAG: hypothetical protein ABR567_22305 [Myxococcales bacterium]|nr:DUF4382 domain-containing protein [Myxococcales bacterium]
MKKLIPLVLMAAACSGSNLSLSVRAGSSAASSASSLTLSNGIAVSRIRIVVRDIKLERARSADAGNDELEEHEMQAGPFLVDLSGTTLDSGAPAQLAAASLPAGTYREIKFKIHRPESSESSDAGIQAMATAGASIVADGTIDGAAFSFSTPMDVEQEVEGSFDLASGSNLTLNVDPSGWFGGSVRLDPRDASVRGQIESNIQHSFKAFKDDNHDGHDDGD